MTSSATATPMTLTTAIRIEASGRPAPKGSRVYGRNKQGHTFTRPASKHEKPWVDAVKSATQLAMRHHAQIEPPYAVDLELRIVASKQPKYPWPSQHDIDKLVRAVIDGLVFGGAISDDRHVVSLTARKRFVEGDEPPGVVAYVSALD